MAQSLVKLTLESNQYERNLKNAQKQLNDFTRSIGINMKSLSGMALAAGAVTGALKVAKDAFFANEQQLDEWGRTVEASKSLYNGFLNALNNTDISGFLTRMDDIMSAAREAYNALDDLNTYSAFNQRNEMKERAGYTKALDEYKLNPTADNKKTLADANKAVIDGLRETQQKTEDAYMAALRQIATERLNDKKLQDEFVKVFSEGGRNALADAKIGYSQGKMLNAGAQYWYGDRVYDGRIQDRSTGKWRDMSQQEKQSFEFARALSQVNDSQIKEVQALGRQSQAIADQIYQQDRAYNRMAGNNGKVTPGPGGGGGSTKTEVVAVTGSIDEQTKKVQELQKAWRAAADDDSRQKIKKEIEEQQHILDYMTGKISAPGKMTIAHGITPTSNIDNPLEKYKDAAIQLKTPLQALEEELKNIRALQEAAWSPEVFAAYEQRAQDVQGKINVFKGIQKDADASAKSFQAAAGAISTVGSALSSIEDPSAKIFGIVAQAIATIANAFASALGSDTTTKGNIWAFIGASAASMTAMAAAIAQIHSATGYASGGVIKGNSYSGDNIGGLVDGSQFVGLNAGEVVLNRAQAGVLAESLQNNNGGGGGYTPSHVSGEQIWIALNRYTRRTGMGELMTWK